MVIRFILAKRTELATKHISLHYTSTFIRSGNKLFTTLMSFFVTNNVIKDSDKCYLVSKINDNVVSYKKDLLPWKLPFCKVFSSLKEIWINQNRQENERLFHHLLFLKENKITENVKCTKLMGQNLYLNWSLKQKIKCPFLKYISGKIKLSWLRNYSLSLQNFFFFFAFVLFSNFDIRIKSEMTWEKRIYLT